jgi:pyruvate dehydrogenase E2 component (dihydrolipoamide acetyltransferase)
MAEIQLPQLGESVTEGTITRWFKKVGEQVAEDEVLFEVSTDKVDSEVPSPVGGTLTEIRVEEGDTVDVGTVIAVVGDGEAASAAEEPAAEEPAAEEPAVEAPAADEAEVAAEEPEAPTAPDASPGGAEAAPAQPEPAPAPAPAPAATNGGTPSAATSGRLLSPIVRQLVNDYNLDPAQIEGTGPGGRITRSDVDRAIQAGSGRAAAPAAPAAPAPTGAAPAPAAPSGGARRPAPAPRSGTGDTVEPLNNIRRRTGEHMVMSKATSPHAYTIVEVDYENVERVRRAHREEFKATEGFSLTYLPFISRAVVDALRQFPHLNATVGDGELVVHNYVNLSVAVDLDFEGLLAPVVRDADDKRLRAIARDINDVAARARTKKLSADDIVGGTFTLSNSGSFGSHLVLPVINQPQVAILSTDGVSRKPVVVTTADGDESIAIHSVGLLGMAWDHRAFDGAYAAAFLREVKEILQTRDWEAELS